MHHLYELLLLLIINLIYELLSLLKNLLRTIKHNSMGA